MSSEKVKRKSIRQKILQFVPVIGHYKLEEEIREWDRSIRDESIDVMENCENILDKILESLVNARKRDSIIELEKSRKRVYKLKETIRTQTYGYFPSKSYIKIDRKNLETVFSIDEEITKSLRKFLEKLQAIFEKFERGSDTEALMDLSEGLSALNEADNLISKRSNIIRSGVESEEETE